MLEAGILFHDGKLFKLYPKHICFLEKVNNYLNTVTKNIFLRKILHR